MNRGRGCDRALFASVYLVCAGRYCQRVSRGSVWPRTCKAFSAKHEACYGVAFSVLQTAKRNGGGVFVAFVVVGGRAVIIWRLYSGRRRRKSPLHSVWPKEPRISTPGHAGNGQGKQ